jgi:hypothetical protein
MKKTIAILAVAGLAAMANAQNTKLVFEVSNDAGATWGSNVSVTPGATVYVRTRVQLVNAGTNTVLGLAGITFQPTLTNFKAADVRNAFDNEATGAGTSENPQTNTGRILPFASAGMGPASASGLLTGHRDPGDILRFAGANATGPVPGGTSNNLAHGVNSAQTPRSISGTNFREGTDVVVFRYAITINDPTVRDMVAGIPQGAVHNNRGAWYRTDAGTGSLLASMTESESATIHVVAVPAPGALALLGLGGMVAARRRR